MRGFLGRFYVGTGLGWLVADRRNRARTGRGGRVCP